VRVCNIHAYQLAGERQFLHARGVGHLGEQGVREGEHEEVLGVALAQVEHRADGRVGVGVAGEHHVEAREFEVGEKDLEALPPRLLVDEALAQGGALREEVGPLPSTNGRWHGEEARTMYGVLSTAQLQDAPVLRS
jgi:hypothetical protein